jgi:Fic family protein
MPKAIPETELSKVEAAIRAIDKGAAIADLVGPKADDADRRNMHRRLKKLISAGRVKTTGVGKATRYWISGTSTNQTLLHQNEAPLESHDLIVRLSDEALDQQKSVRRPIKQRTPVGYKREFLSDYRPNETFYLSPRERKYLSGIGSAQLGAQPAGTYARQILGRLLIDIAWNSSRLEGNQYSILDTKVLIEQGKSAEGKSAQDTQMILNHKEAIEFLVENATEIAFDRRTVVNLHAALSENLLPDPQASGRLRQRAVEIAHSVYLPLSIPAAIEDCFNELLVKAASILDPYEQAFFVLVQLPYLQPFEDVNKRVSRLAANIPFIKENLSPVSFIDVGESLYRDALLSVYELNGTELARDVFIWAYERSAARYAALRQSIGQPDPFRLKYREMLRNIVADVIREQLDKTAAANRVGIWAAQNVPIEDQARFVEIAESELIGMHEGNFARYRVRPTEYYAWKQIWDQDK